jgi:uncharacterized phiE125 gp8 family phage protein
MSYPSFGYGNGYREYGSLTNGAVFTPYPSDLTVTVEPVGVVVDVALIKQGLPDYGLEADTLIEIMIKGVTEQIEKYLGRDLLTRTRKAIYYNVGRMVYLMPVPVASVTLVQTLDREGTGTTLVLNEGYYLRGYKDNLQMYDILMGGNDALEVTYTSGYGSASSVPNAIKQAIIQETYRQFKRRNDVDVSAGTTVDSLSPEAQAMIRGFVKRWA